MYSCRSDEACRRHVRRMTYRCGQVSPFPQTRALETVLTSNCMNRLQLVTKIVSGTNVYLLGGLEY